MELTRRTCNPVNQPLSKLLHASYIRTGLQTRLDLDVPARLDQMQMGSALTLSPLGQVPPRAHASSRLYKLLNRLLRNDLCTCARCSPATEN